MWCHRYGASLVAQYGQYTFQAGIRAASSNARAHTVPTSPPLACTSQEGLGEVAPRSMHANPNRRNDARPLLMQIHGSSM
eukprot:7474992-Pyramimonas_sp.AAC.1